MAARKKAAPAKRTPAKRAAKAPAAKRGSRRRRSSSSSAHHPDCGEVGETGDHGDLGANGIEGRRRWLAGEYDRQAAAQGIEVAPRRGRGRKGKLDAAGIAPTPAEGQPGA